MTNSNGVNHDINIIEIKDVSFSYGKAEVLKNISLDIHQGDYIALIGPNGAGKTTLLKLMLGLLQPKSGNISLLGQPLKQFKDWHKIGYVPQKPANVDLNFPATVEEVVLMGLYERGRLFNRYTDSDRLAAQQALASVNMSEFSERLIGDLSGGQQQRVFIARALVHQPEIIFLDEPTAGIDKQNQDAFYALLRKLNQSYGITLILVSHDLATVTREVMHIACIDQTLTCHTSPEEYLKESQTAEIQGQEVKLMTHHQHNHR